MDTNTQRDHVRASPLLGDDLHAPNVTESPIHSAAAVQDVPPNLPSDGEDDTAPGEQRTPHSTLPAGTPMTSSFGLHHPHVDARQKMSDNVHYSTFHTPAVCRTTPQSAEEWLRLNVGGRVFTTSVATLCADPNSLLAHICASFTRHRYTAQKRCGERHVRVSDRSDNRSTNHDATAPIASSPPHPHTRDTTLAGHCFIHPPGDDMALRCSPRGGPGRLENDSFTVNERHVDPGLSCVTAAHAATVDGRPSRVIVEDNAAAAVEQVVDGLCADDTAAATETRRRRAIDPSSISSPLHASANPGVTSMTATMVSADNAFVNEAGLEQMATAAAERSAQDADVPSRAVATHALHRRNHGSNNSFSSTSTDVSLTPQSGGQTPVIARSGVVAPSSTRRATRFCVDGDDGTGGELASPGHPATFLPIDADEHNSILLDLDPDYFAPVLNYLRHRTVMIPPNLSVDGVRAVAEYLNVQGLVRQLTPAPRARRQLLFSWGSGGSGELGTQLFQDSPLPAPVQVTPFGVRVTHMALGANYSCVLSDDGNVYTFGNGDWGQLGLGNPKELDTHPVDKSAVVAVPRRIPLFEQQRAVQVSAGYAFAMAITEGHHVYFWGNNNHSQSGLGAQFFDYSRKKIDRPRLIETLEGKRIVKVGCGSFFSLALSAEGQLYSWGLIECLGLGTPDEVRQRYRDSNCLGESLSNEKRGVLLTPQLVRIPGSESHPIVHIHAGQWHSGAINDIGELFTWGVGYQGRLGHGSREPAYIPTKVRGELKGHRVVDVACGSFHTVALTATGAVFCWGDNASGQCGASASSTEAVLLPYRVVGLEFIAGGVARGISCGRQHTVVVMEGPQPDCPCLCCQLDAHGRPRHSHGQVYTFGESVRGGGPSGTGITTRAASTAAGNASNAHPTPGLEGTGTGGGGGGGNTIGSGMLNAGSAGATLATAGAINYGFSNAELNQMRYGGAVRGVGGGGGFASLMLRSAVAPAGAGGLPGAAYGRGAGAYDPVALSLAGRPVSNNGQYQRVAGLEAFDVQGVVSGLYHTFVYAEELSINLPGEREWYDDGDGDTANTYTYLPRISNPSYTSPRASCEEDVGYLAERHTRLNTGQRPTYNPSASPLRVAP